MAGRGDQRLIEHDAESRKTAEILVKHLQSRKAENSRAIRGEIGTAVIS